MQPAVGTASGRLTIRVEALPSGWSPLQPWPGVLRQGCNRSEPGDTFGRTAFAGRERNSEMTSIVKMMVLGGIVLLTIGALTVPVLAREQSRLCLSPISRAGDGVTIRPALDRYVLARGQRELLRLAD
jgi:hypothetical protein